MPLEIAILHDLYNSPHPNIPRMRLSFSDFFYYYIVMEYQPAMDLFDYITKNTMQEASIKTVFKQVLDAVQHIHSLGIVHRDIKDENILIGQDGIVTLIDYGSSAYIIDGPFNTFFGTKLYSPPEILEGKYYKGPAQDIWQLGILLYTMIFREPPFYSVEDILHSEVRFPFVISKTFEILLRGMLCKNVETRFTLEFIQRNQVSEWNAL
jgi:serine/threonine protein kinase